MSTPYTRDEHPRRQRAPGHAGDPEIAGILRQVASHDGHLDARRGYVSITLAALVEAVGRGYRDVSPEIARWTWSSPSTVQPGQRR